MWEADKSCEAYKRVYTCYSIVLFVSSSTLQLWAWKISTEAATIVPSAGNCHSKCHLCRGRGFELLRKQGKLFRTTRWSPSLSRSSSPRVTCTACILAAFDKHFQDQPWGEVQECKYLLLTECAVHTVSYGPSFFPRLMAEKKEKKRGSITYSTAQANEVNKMFIVWL